MTVPTQLGDMHHAAVALEELGGTATAQEIADRLNWFTEENVTDATLDTRRVETALSAAAEHGLVIYPRSRRRTRWQIR